MIVVAEVKMTRVTNIEGKYIQTVHQKVHELETSVEKVMPEHVNFDLVEHMQKIEEEVHTKIKKVVKIMEYFHKKINATHQIE